MTTCWGLFESAQGNFLRRIVLIFGLFTAFPAWLHATTPLVTILQVRELSGEQAARRIPVQLKSVATYYNAPKRILIVADKTSPILILVTQAFSLKPGDLILLRGVMGGSFHLLNVKHLLYVIEVLAAIVLASLIWGVMLRRRVYEQTLQIRRNMNYEAERERRQAFLEKQRSRVLEAINSPMPLSDVLRMITALISQQMGGVECRCEFAMGAEVAAGRTKLAEGDKAREERRDILSSSGERLGGLVLISRRGAESRFGTEIIDIGVNLAALAIDNRRLYERLIQRSEYDQLTEIPNRFLLESRLGEAHANAEQHGHKFALIYIDLDRFKSVNDRFGHRVGDTYLQHVASRLQEKLRNGDTLARVGGDEFIVVIPVVRDRSEAEEIAWRLEGCFDAPFRVDDHTIEGSASVGFAVYPEDGEDEEQLKRFADAAMYAGKQRASGLGLR